MRNTVGNLVGRTFGRLLVTSQADDERNGATRWHCTCECGSYKDVRGSNLTSGAVVSCGCWRRDIQRVRARQRNERVGRYGQWRRRRFGS